MEIEGDGDGEDSFQDARDAEYEAKFNRKVSILVVHPLVIRRPICVNLRLPTSRSPIARCMPLN